jgi:hypothetical protein
MLGLNQPKHKQAHIQMEEWSAISVGVALLIKASLSIVKFACTR